jgi:dihydropteroate synthase
MFKRPQIMGILNVTPDSFSDGGRYDALEQAVKRGIELIDDGADILDIGGESTRPGAKEISINEEIRRTVPVIAALRAQSRDLHRDITISIDTRKPDVAEAAIYAGADIWNDVTALTFDPRSEAMAAELSCRVVIMHMQGSPETMQNNPHYGHAVNEVKTYLAKRIDSLDFAGVERRNITIDVGIGFGKTLDDNLTLMANLALFKDLGCPMLMGASRKSFIGKIDGSTVNDRLGGSLAAALWSAQAGASIVRVHDVSETAQALKVWDAVSRA